MSNNSEFSGNLKIKLSKNGSGQPDHDAKIEIFTHNTNSLLHTLYTDENGEVLVELPAVDPNISMSPNFQHKPYSKYDVRATQSGEIPVFFNNVQVMSGVTTVQAHEMKPLSSSQAGNIDIVDNPDNVNDFAPGGSSVPAVTVSVTAEPALNEESSPYESVLVPEYITVHMGAPGSSDINVTVPFNEYIKSVASSEVYPTWPREALKSNIIAQITLALNRVYTEWYRSRGYDFDITSSPAFDQYYVHGRATFESIDEIVDEVLTQYVGKVGHLEPLFTEYCDGRIKNCMGLHQWGTVELAEQNYSAVDILKHYYGSTAYLSQSDYIAPITPSFNGDLKIGNESPNVKLAQDRLNRIAINYPAIPFIEFADGIFDLQTEFAVAEFQHVFDLPQTGVIDSATWYKIINTFNGVTKLAELESEGVRIVNDGYPNRVLNIGSVGTDVLKMENYLTRIGDAWGTNIIPKIIISGTFDNSLRNAVAAYQQHRGLTANGIINKETWDSIVTDFYNLPPLNNNPMILPYPGTALYLGSTGSNVRYIQTAMNAIRNAVPDMVSVEVDGNFGPVTKDAVISFQNYYGLNADGIIGRITWNKINELYNVYLNNPS